MNGAFGLVILKDSWFLKCYSSGEVALIVRNALLVPVVKGKYSDWLKGTNGSSRENDLQL